MASPPNGQLEKSPKEKLVPVSAMEDRRGISDREDEDPVQRDGSSQQGGFRSADRQLQVDGQGTPGDG